jgi:hypothetical protein
VTNFVSPVIRFQPESLQISGHGAVTGVLYFVIDGRSFPDESWNDFVVVILSWWCLALLRLVSRPSVAEQLRFMDGPFAVQVELSDDGRAVALRFLRQDRLVSSGVMPRDELLKQVVSAGCQVLEFCERAGAIGDDVEQLRKGVAALSES